MLSATWWRHQTLSALLAITKASDAELWCFLWSSPGLNKRLDKQWWGWWFETPSHQLCRHCNEMSTIFFRPHIINLCIDKGIHYTIAIQKQALSPSNLVQNNVFRQYFRVILLPDMIIHCILVQVEYKFVAPLYVVLALWCIYATPLFVKIGTNAGIVLVGPMDLWKHTSVIFENKTYFYRGKASENEVCDVPPISHDDVIKWKISSVLLALCAGKSPVSGEFPSQRPVTQSFDVFFDLWLNERLSKQSCGWWSETPSCLLWRHCNVKMRCVTWRPFRLGITTFLAGRNGHHQACKADELIMIHYPIKLGTSWYDKSDIMILKTPKPQTVITLVPWFAQQIHNFAYMWYLCILLTNSCALNF